MVIHTYTDGKERNRMRITFDLTKEDMATVIAKTIDEDTGKKATLPKNEEAEDWTKKKIREVIRNGLKLNGQSEYEFRANTSDKQMEIANELIGKYYDFDLSKKKKSKKDLGKMK